MELATEALSYNNQNIASEAPKLLLCSSIASVSDQGSNKGVTPLAGIGKEHPELNWYY
ncbi:transcriptional regulator, partial [Phocaeicola vulgatus]